MEIPSMGSDSHIKCRSRRWDLFDLVSQNNTSSMAEYLASIYGTEKDKYVSYILAQHDTNFMCSESTAPFISR